MLPYSREVFFALFERLNAVHWWAQAPASIALGLALALLIALRRDPARRTVAARWGCLLLAAQWAGSGALWHFGLFAKVNFLAPLYGGLALAQAAALALYAAKPLPGSGDRPSLGASATGYCLMGAALAFPLLDAFGGAGWSAARWPGVSPSPLIPATAGLLLLRPSRVQFALLAVPALLGGVASYNAWVLRIPQDALPLLAVAVAGAVAAHARAADRAASSPAG